MLTRTIAAGLIALSTLAAVPAQATGLSVQVGPGYGWSDNGHGDRRGHWRRHHRDEVRLSQEEVRWMLRDRGYRNIRFFDTRGPIYELRARKRGDAFYLVVNARTGEILSRQRI